MFSRCNILNIEPKVEKASKPQVCQNHFSLKDFRETDSLTCRAVPKKTLRRHNKTKPDRNKLTSKRIERETKINKKTKTSKNEDKAEVRLEFEEWLKIAVKVEPVDEITIEEHRFEDQQTTCNSQDADHDDISFLESLLPFIRQMTENQKKIFLREMIALKSECSF